jgi:putative acetyltransferase
MHMNAAIQIRPEETADAGGIESVTLAAFAHHPFSHQTEQFIVRELRLARVLTLSMVAVMNGNIVGHIAYSPVSFEDGTPGWLGVGPLSVAPKLQRQGIGKALVERSLEIIRARAIHGCVLVGPSEYYNRFGFQAVGDIVHPGVPPQYVLSLLLAGPQPRGIVTFHKAFEAQS